MDLLRALGLSSLQKRRIREDLRAFQHLEATCKRTGEGLLQGHMHSGMVKLKGITLDIRKKMVRHWHRLLREVVGAPFLEGFKASWMGL